MGKCALVKAGKMNEKFWQWTDEFIFAVEGFPSLISFMEEKWVCWDDFG